MDTPLFWNPDHPNFSFLYDGVPFSEILDRTAVTVEEQEQNQEFTRYTISYTLPDGLTVVQLLTLYRKWNAAHWVLRFANYSEKKSGLLSQVRDCDMAFPFLYDRKTPVAGHVIPENTARVFRTIGSDWKRDEFASYPEFLSNGQARHYACVGGRSSQGLAPFFDVNQGRRGVLCAIGWTGQWNADFSCQEDEIIVRTGMEDLCARLLPGEEIRTTAVLLLCYKNGQDGGHNEFRQLIRAHHCLIGKPGRPKQGPLTNMFWGALSSEEMVKKIRLYKEYDVCGDDVWVDAGWYGESTGPCPDEFTGDWGCHTGNWKINRTYHPDQMKQVALACREAGMGFLLWVEPERVVKTTPQPQEHPEWFLHREVDDGNLLLDLGNPEARQATIELIAGLIDRLGLTGYRQDFNFDPLPYWRYNDQPDRRGIHEIRHICGLYAFWDALLARYPHLYIDNCASGGKRIDIETYSRSIPLWRSDYQCTFDCDPETAQIHNTGISWWLPYSGTGVGRVMGDTYRIRSCYASGLTNNFWGYEDRPFLPDSQPLDWVRKQFAEYRKCKPYFCCDYYPMARLAMDDYGWTGWQFDRAEQGDGLIMAFRRPLSPFPEAVFSLGGVQKEKTYYFTNHDTAESFSLSGKELAEKGLKLWIPEKRDSRVLFYQIL